MTSFFLYCIKKMSFSGSPKGTPHDWCRRTMKKKYPEPKKCSICWVSHMFSIWEYRYSYGICFGTVYALQNSTPNISTPNILSFFFSVHTRRVEIGHILSRRSWLYIYISSVAEPLWHAGIDMARKREGTGLPTGTQFEWTNLTYLLTFRKEDAMCKLRTSPWTTWNHWSPYRWRNQQTCGQ